MVTIRWREGWVPLSANNIGWFVKIKSIHDEELEGMWDGSCINCLRPLVEEKESICTPSLLDMSYLHQFEDRALKSPVVMGIDWLIDWFIAFIKISKLLFID